MIIEFFDPSHVNPPRCHECRTTFKFSIHPRGVRIPYSCVLWMLTEPPPFSLFVIEYMYSCLTCHLVTILKRRVFNFCTCIQSYIYTLICICTNAHEFKIHMWQDSLIWVWYNNQKHKHVRFYSTRLLGWKD